MSNINFMTKRMQILQGDPCMIEQTFLPEFFKTDKFIFPIKADNVTQIINDFQTLAKSNQVIDQNIDKISLIGKTLRRLNDQKTLLVFSDAKSNNFIIDNLDHLLPVRNCIDVIITTRDSSWNRDRFEVLDKLYNYERQQKYFEQILRKILIGFNLKPYCKVSHPIFQNVHLKQMSHELDNVLSWEMATKDENVDKIECPTRFQFNSSTNLKM